MKDKIGRIGYIDSARGIALLLVIFGHTFRESMCGEYPLCDFAYLFVYKFHVPLFFILSGICFSIAFKCDAELGTYKYLKRKGRSVLLPWLLYSVFIYLIYFAVSVLPFISGVFGECVPLTRYIKLMLCNENPYAFHLWFLNTLFIFLVLIYLSDKYMKGISKYIKLALLVILPVIYTLWAGKQVWVIKAVFQQMPYFIIGTFVSCEFIENNAKKLIGSGALCFIGLGVFTAVQNNLNISEAGWFLLLYVKYIAVIVLSLGIISGCFLAEKKFSVLHNLGRNSITYYLFHQPFCCAFAGELLYDVLKLPVVLVLIICMILSLAVPTVILKIMSKCKGDQL